MATKKCPNGHQYDSSIYGDSCPFCPTSGGGHTKVNNDYNDYGGETRATGGWGGDSGETIPMGDAGIGGHTVIRTVAVGAGDNDSGKKLVGLLVSYSAKASGEVYKVYEGRTIIGRDPSCDISFPGDNHMSMRHLIIQYVAANGSFRIQDQGSSNGTYLNGTAYVMGDVMTLKSNDILVLGSTKLIFMAIPEF